MPEKRTVARAKRDLRQGKSPSTAAGEFVKEEMDHIRSGKHGASAELLSAADQVRVDDYWRAELVRLECDFPYDAAFGVTTTADAEPLPAATR